MSGRPIQGVVLMITNPTRIVSFRRHYQSQFSWRCVEIRNVYPHKQELILHNFGF